MDHAYVVEADQEQRKQKLLLSTKMAGTCFCVKSSCSVVGFARIFFKFWQAGQLFLKMYMPGSVCLSYQALTYILGTD